MRRVVLAALAFAGAAFCATPSFWETSGFTDFMKGKLDGVSLARDGRITLAPKLDTWFDSGQPVIWSVATAVDGTVYAGTGNNGRVYRIQPDGKSSVLWTADRPEVFALTVDSKGVVYAGSSPDGKIYRIENGKATEYFDPHTRYIWALAVAADGTLYAGTGDGGRIFHITAAGRGEEHYATGEGNVTSLLIDARGRLLAGTEPNGILYEITGKGKAFALHDSNLPEIRAVATGPANSIYAVALGGSLAKKVQGALPGSGAAVDTGLTTSTSITVTAAAGTDLKPPPAPAKPPAATAAPAPADAAVTTTPATSGSNDEKSAIYRIEADNTVDTLWSSKEENVYDIVPVADGVYFGTDVNGRIYHLSTDRKLTLVTETKESEVTRLLQTKGAILAATANSGKLYKLGSAAARGAYESSVFDAGGVAHWGQLQWRGAGAVAIRTRSGNGGHPDATWSDWAPLNNGRIASPNARYLQYTAELSGSSAAIENVSAAYLQQNRAPVISSITVMSTPASSTATAPAAANAKGPTFSVSVTDTGDATPVSSTGTPVETISRAAPQQLTISWAADDPDGDKLAYSLDFRGEGEREWKPIKRDLHDASYSIDQDALPDGRYYFRVTASDREANPAGTAKESDLVSSPVLIDNTPPLVKVQSAARAGSGADISFSAEDAGSPLRRAEWAIDAGEWTPVAPLDGLLDSQTEQFRLHIDNFPAGEHLLVIRVADTAGNTGLGKAILH